LLHGTTFLFYETL